MLIQGPGCLAALASNWRHEASARERLGTPTARRQAEHLRDHAERLEDLAQHWVWQRVLPASLRDRAALLRRIRHVRTA
ncbi:hypothetical protein [Xanthomonas phaseoli]|uniref:hypothetical protein n=1 Tax=Xanthomonas phaseoli TaxID=1985254 RepID=UPI0002DF5272|nr:hypothetical protein [Xanthomonas phaseoli]